ncbi:dipeptidase [Propioniciclava soli]|uniref:dipeptidase n=1 Tax=Propioniciclava soli TaxID=2775081 RepID=UPI001E3D217B
MNDLRRTVSDLLPGVLADLTDLVAIRSVSSLPAHHGDVSASADAVAGLLRGAGCPDVRIVAEGGQPAVIGRWPAPEGAPTVCLYAHHDVQPTGDPDAWTSPPFEVTERGGRLHARGVVDDKAGVAVHLAALRAFGGTPPVGVTVFVEGEEEVGSPTLAAILERHRDLLAADVYVICDSANWAVGTPAFTTTLRGLADLVVEVSTLDHALHSGQYGGVAPDALTALVRLLATLHDDAGDVAVAGLVRDDGFPLEHDADRLRAEAGVLDGVELLGTGPLADRLWTRPAITVLAVDAPSVAQASNTLTATARAKISVRLAPGQNGPAALTALKDHLTAHAPWGARLTFGAEHYGHGSQIPLEGPVADAAVAAFTQAWGTDPVQMGQGGSIPMVADFQRTFPDATVLVTGVCDPDSRMHGIDESLDLGDFGKACLAEALLLAELGAAVGRG